VHATSLLKLVLSQILAPAAPAPIYRWYFRRRRGWPREPWRLYSVANPRFAESIGLTARMREAHHDPTFVTSDTRQIRLRMLKPGRNNMGSVVQCMAAGFGLEIRDPTIDKRVLEFCLSIPDRQYGRGGQSRLLVRRAMNGLMPREVLWNPRRGIQLSDLGERLRRESADVRNAIERIERGDAARELLDLDRIRKALLVSADTRFDHGFLATANTAIRGLAVGLFLERCA